MIKTKKTSIIILMIILGSSLSLYYVQALSRETPELTELIQKIYDSVNHNTGLINELSESITTKYNALSESITTKYTELRSLISDKHRTTDGLINDVSGQVRNLDDDGYTYYTDIHSDLFHINEYVDEVEANQATIIDYVDSVEDNQQTIIQDLDAVEEHLTTIDGTLALIKFNIFADHDRLENEIQYNGDAITSNGDAIANLQASIDEASTQLANIEAALARLESRDESNVIMKTYTESFETPGTQFNIFEKNYPSIRHVSLTINSGELVDDTWMSLNGFVIEITVDLPDGEYGNIHLSGNNWESVNHFEFDTDHWKVSSIKTIADDRSLKASFNIVTFEEA